MTLPSWHLRRMQVPDAWRTTRGEDIEVAVLDSGMAPVPALGDFRSWDHRGRSIAAADVSRYSHGTACAALIGSRDPRVQGVAPGASLVSVRVTTASGVPALQYVTEAFRTLARTNVKVASCSFTLGRFPPSLASSIADFARGGGIVVAPAGRRGDNDRFPRMCPAAIVVGGVVPGDRPLSTVNRGRCVDVCAPAKHLPSFDRRGRPLQFGKTSGATALVAGACALVLSDAAHRGRLDVVTLALERLLRDTADDVGVRGPDTVTGFGVVNARKLLARARQL